MRVLLPLSVVLVIVAAVLLSTNEHPSSLEKPALPVAPLAATTTATSTPPKIISAATTTAATSSSATATTSKKLVSKLKNAPPQPEAAPSAQVVRTQTPYSVPPQTLTSFDAPTRSALVNILCMPKGGTLRPISGSGVIIDPRGVILTNAHVAQYVLLTENTKINLECTVRTGSPSSTRWKADVLYIPPVWVTGHYTDVNADHVMGTGEHDYALLLIVSDIQGNPITAPLPYLPVETRENVAFQDDAVLGAGYPAEFVGGIVAQQGLYAVTSISTIKQLLTFETSSVDVFSVGGVIEAQGGSSGGPVVNAWGYVVAIISTTSQGATTAERDLHALSLSYINKDIIAQTGQSLPSLLTGDLRQELLDFSRETAPGLIQKYISFLMH